MWLLLLTGLALASSEPGVSFPLTTESALARSRFMEGLEHFDHQRMSAARQAFEASLEADPRFAIASAYLVIAMNYTGDVESRRLAALDQKASASESERLAIEALLAWSESDYSAAKERTLVLLEREPDSVQAHYELGWHHYKSNDFEAAIASTSRAVELDPGFVPALLLGGRAELARGRVHDARRMAEETLALAESPPAHTLHGDALKREGNLDDAVVSYDAALALDPGFVPALSGRADALRIAADYVRATAAYRALCDVTTALPDGSYKELYLDWTKAEDVCFDYGMTHLLAGELGEARRIFEATAHYTAEARMANAPIFYNALGRFLLETGSLDEAEEVYERSLEVSRKAGVSPRMQELWNGRYLLALGRIEARRGNFEKARGFAAELKGMIDGAGDEGAPFLPAHHYLMGYVLLEEERYAEAVEHLEKTRLADPFNRWLLARAVAGTSESRRAGELVVDVAKTPPGSYGHALAIAEVRRWLDEHGGIDALEEEAAARRLPKTPAGDLVRRAIRYATSDFGSWERKKNVSYTKTTKHFAPDGVRVERTVVEKHRYVLRPELRVRIDRDEDGKTVSLVNDGSHARKYVDGELATDPESRNHARNSTFGSHYVFAMPYKLADSGVVFTRVGEHTLPDGTLTDELVVDYERGAGNSGGLHTWTYYFAKDDARLVANHLKTGESPAERTFTTYHDLETIGWLRMPTRRRAFGYDEEGVLGALRTEITYTDVHFDVELPDGSFEPAPPPSGKD